ncbi:hypothetical protein ASE38_02455 [Cellulomonas sp. Root930]|nr:hypothetical protein ASE38_02455 [Cellulomonas sp. Root930]
MSAPVGHAAHLAPVELDELDGLRAPDGGDRSRRFPAARVTATVVALVLVLLGVQSWLDARERARLRYLAEVPGVLRALADPPGVLWRWTPGVGALVAGDSAGGWAVGADYHPGGVTLRGTDPDTGDQRWSVPFSLDAALPPGGRSEFPSVWVRCTVVRSDDAPLAVCAAEVSPVASGGAATPLAVLDPATGSVLATPTVPAGTLWAATDSLLVRATPAEDGRGGVRWTLTATDPTTGSVQWRSSTPVVPQVHEVRIGDDVFRSEPALAADDDRVLLTDSGHAWLFGADGSPRGDVTVATDGWAELGRSGTLVWMPWQNFAVPAGVLVTAAGARVAVGELPARLSVDDGTAPGVVLLTGDDGGWDGVALVARDAVTGDELWRADGVRGEPLLVDGVVHVAQGADVVARDARSGEVRWSVPLGAAPAYLGTDGSLVVVVTPDRTLHGLELADGRLALSVDLNRLTPGDPAGIDQVADYAGRLLVRFRDGSGIVLG